jgi:hypothetical protein
MAAERQAVRQELAYRRMTIHRSKTRRRTSHTSDSLSAKAIRLCPRGYNMGPSARNTAGDLQNRRSEGSGTNS